jgi:hypothetical protein
LVKKLKINSVRNPLSEKPVPTTDDLDFFGIKLLTPTNDLVSFTKTTRVTGTTTNSISFSPSPTISLSDDTTGRVSSYTIKIFPQIEIPASPDGSIELVLPPEVIY